MPKADVLLLCEASRACLLTLLVDQTRYPESICHFVWLRNATDQRAPSLNSAAPPGDFELNTWFDIYVAGTVQDEHMVVASVILPDTLRPVYAEHAITPFIILASARMTGQAMDYARYLMYNRPLQDIGKTIRLRVLSSRVDITDSGHYGTAADEFHQRLGSAYWPLLSAHARPPEDGPDELPRSGLPLPEPQPRPDSPRPDSAFDSQ